MHHGTIRIGGARHHRVSTFALQLFLSKPNLFLPDRCITSIIAQLTLRHGLRDGARDGLQEGLRALGGLHEEIRGGTAERSPAPGTS